MDNPGLLASAIVFPVVRGVRAVVSISELDEVSGMMMMMIYLLLVMIMMMTMMGACRYAYSDDGGDDFDHEENVSLIKPALLQSNDNWSVSSPDGKTAITIDSPPDEEDKRE